MSLITNKVSGSLKFKDLSIGDNLHEYIVDTAMLNTYNTAEILKQLLPLTLTTTIKEITVQDDIIEFITDRGIHAFPSEDTKYIDSINGKDRTFYIGIFIEDNLEEFIETVKKL